MRYSTLLSTVVLAISITSSAFAADGDEAKPVVAASATTTATTTTSTTNGPADHDLVVGKIGIGYLGQLDVPLGPNGSLPTQILGGRYWLSPTMAITGGLGFGTVSSSSTTGGTTVDGPAATAFALKGGVALALASGKHYTFVIEPQAVIGYATQTIKPTGGGGNIENTGTRIALGATAGAEIQFGFIGIPELALIGSVGLAFDTLSGKTKTDAGETSASRTSVTTFALSNPWNIFSGNVAAIYYF
jgi:hypothetical protein